MSLIQFVIFTIFCSVLSMSYKIEQLPVKLALLGEGPHWDIEKQSLYFLDSPRGTIHRYSYDENKVYNATIKNEKQVSFIIPVDGEEDRFAVGIGKRVGVIIWDGSSGQAVIERIVFEVEQEEKYKYNQFNDAKADPNGRLFAGTMQTINQDALPEDRTGNLYTYSKGGNVTHIRDKIAISNGLAWNQKRNKMYYIDSRDFRVREFDYDFAKGTLGEERVLSDFHENGKQPDFAPDGMTIDSEGFLYVAAWDGAKIMKIDPSSGKIVMTFDFPCEKITSCAFGGPNLDILYATSASFESKPTEFTGATFKVSDVEAKGLPMQKVRL